MELPKNYSLTFQVINGKMEGSGNVHTAPPVYQAFFASAILETAQQLITRSLFAACTPAKRDRVMPNDFIKEAEFVRASPWGNAWTIASEEWGGNQAITVEKGWFLYGLIRAIKPRYCVEFGTSHGLSALFIGKALKDNKFGKLVTIDLNDNGQAKRLASRGLKDCVECKVMDEKDFVPDQKIDFFFHDSVHNFKGVMDAFNKLEPHFSAGAVIVVDDTRIETSEVTACKQFCESRRCQGFNVLSDTGLFIFRFGEGKHEEFSINDVYEPSLFYEDVTNNQRKETPKAS